MGCLGVSFGLNSDEVKHFRSLKTDEDRRYQAVDILDETLYDTDRAYDSEKAWCGIHVCLTNNLFKQRFPDAPLDHVIYGGEQVYFDDDYIMSLCDPDKVQQLAKILPLITQAEMSKAYREIEPNYLGIPGDESDEEYTWFLSEDMVPFWLRAAERGQYVLFTASQ